MLINTGLAKQDICVRIKRGTMLILLLTKVPLGNVEILYYDKSLWPIYLINLSRSLLSLGTI